MQIFCDILNSNYLEQNKNNSWQKTSKPSKALIDALKHSTNVTKALKNQKLELTKELRKVNHENQMLKKMLEKLTIKNQQLESFNQDRQKKACESEAKLIFEVKLFKNANNLLKKQIKGLRQKQEEYNNRSSNDIYSSEVNSEINIVTQGSKNEVNQPWYNHVVNQPQKRNKIKDDMMFESAKFNEYVNHGNNHNTKAYNPKIQECQPEKSQNQQNFNLKVDMFIHAKDSQVTVKRQMSLANEDSIDLIGALLDTKNRQSNNYSDQTSKANDQNSKIIVNRSQSLNSNQVSTFTEDAQSPNQKGRDSSGFSVFAYGIQEMQSQKKEKKKECLNVLEQPSVKKIEDYTFLNIQTKKSIFDDKRYSKRRLSTENNQNVINDNAEGQCQNQKQPISTLDKLKKSSSNCFTQSDGLSLSCECEQNNLPLKQIDPAYLQKQNSLKLQIVDEGVQLDSQRLHNLSNCDYTGLLDDILNGGAQDSVKYENNQPQPQQQYNQSINSNTQQFSQQDKSKSKVLQLAEVIKKYTQSQLFDESNKSYYYQNIQKQKQQKQQQQQKQQKQQQEQKQCIQKKQLSKDHHINLIQNEQNSQQNIQSQRKEGHFIRFDQQSSINISMTGDKQQNEQQQSLSKGIFPQYKNTTESFKTILADSVQYNNNKQQSCSCSNRQIRNNNKNDHNHSQQINDQEHQGHQGQYQSGSPKSIIKKNRFPKYQQGSDSFRTIILKDSVCNQSSVELYTAQHDDSSLFFNDVVEPKNGNSLRPFQPVLVEQSRVCTNFEKNQQNIGKNNICKEQQSSDNHQNDDKQSYISSISNGTGKVRKNKTKLQIDPNTNISKYRINDSSGNINSSRVMGSSNLRKFNNSRINERPKSPHTAKSEDRSNAESRNKSKSNTNSYVSTRQQKITGNSSHVKNLDKNKYLLQMMNNSRNMKKVKPDAEITSYEHLPELIHDENMAMTEREDLENYGQETISDSTSYV